METRIEILNIERQRVTTRNASKARSRETLIRRRETPRDPIEDAAERKNATLEAKHSERAASLAMSDKPASARKLNNRLLSISITRRRDLSRNRLRYWAFASRLLRASTRLRFISNGGGGSRLHHKRRPRLIKVETSAPRNRAQASQIRDARSGIAGANYCG